MSSSRGWSHLATTCGSFYPASVLMQHKGMAIDYLGIHLPPGIMNSLRKYLLTKADYHHSEGWKSCQANCGDTTVKGKRHLSAQAASVLGADEGEVLLAHFTRGFFWILEKWDSDVSVCALKPGMWLGRFRQAARMWRVRHVLPSKGRAGGSVGSGSTHLDMPSKLSAKNQI